MTFTSLGRYAAAPPRRSQPSCTSSLFFILYSSLGRPDLIEKTMLADVEAFRADFDF